MNRERVTLYDTTLRDGAQTTGVDFSLEDKRQIAAMLDELGVDYIEGGYPGANPLDTEFFAAKPKIRARFCAFGMTRRQGRSVENDPGVAALLDSAADAVTFVAKSWDYQVRVALRSTEEDNVAAIVQSVTTATARGRHLRVHPAVGEDHPEAARSPRLSGVQDRLAGLILDPRETPLERALGVVRAQGDRRSPAESAAAFDHASNGGLGRPGPDRQPGGILADGPRYSPDGRREPVLNKGADPLASAGDAAFGRGAHLSCLLVQHAALGADSPGRCGGAGKQGRSAPGHRLRRSPAEAGGALGKV